MRERERERERERFRQEKSWGEGQLKGWVILPPEEVSFGRRENFYPRADFCTHLEKHIQNKNQKSKNAWQMLYLFDLPTPMIRTPGPSPLGWRRFLVLQGCDRKAKRRETSLRCHDRNAREH